MCWVAALGTKPLYLVTAYLALHAGTGLVCCLVGLLCTQLLLITELSLLQDLLIQEKEKLYVELKNILARQPGPEVAEQLSLYQVSSFVGGGHLHLQISAAGPPQMCPCLVWLGRGPPVCGMHTLSTVRATWQQAPG